MADFVIKTGDLIQVTIDPPAIVPPLMPPIPLVGSSTTMSVMGVPACLKGDELPVEVSTPLPYTAPPFVTPGMGTLKIILLPDNLTVRTKNQAEIILKGATFPVMFEVSTPAMMPTPAGPVPDPVAVKPGTAQFITTDVRAKAT
jgi:hypothetical protein